MLSTRDPPQNKGHIQTENEGLEKDIPCTSGLRWVWRNGRGPHLEGRQEPQQEHWSGLPFPFPMRESEVTQSYLTLSDPMDCSPPGSSVHGIFQAGVLECSLSVCMYPLF